MLNSGLTILTAVRFDRWLLCYRRQFPFMQSSLRLENDGSCLQELYKGTVWKGNPGLMYMAASARIHEAQASWIVKYLVGEIGLPRDLGPTIADWVERYILHSTYMHGPLGTQ